MGRKMSKPQQIAFANPCYVAEDCTNERYRRIVQVSDATASIVLTLNVGLE